MNPNARAEVLKLKGAKTGKFDEADPDDYNKKLEQLAEYFETEDEGIKAKEQTDKTNAK
jgi:ABC-type Fe3+-hydroxamate transport system substrate-binding protein